MRLAAELGRWRRAGRCATLWWRDDDARAATPALRRLLVLSDAHRTPLTLAVIPDGRLRELAALLGGRPWVSVVQHGVDHLNRRDGAAAGEFPHEWSEAQLAERLNIGWRQVERLPGALRMFTPPWNDVHPALPQALLACGYTGLSAWGEIAEAGPRIDAHIDLMRWKKGARFRGRRRMWSALRVALRARRRAGLWDAPIGLLSHHLDHDEDAWAFLEALLAWAEGRPELKWKALADLT
ncbi:polysaccharide deacetylase family protein [Phenylobacterium soli]|uniref:Polysaccharide deacetylase n=1 Tax=Phenylobacterium soli TaxID=2170551 RepID=A0A328AJA4_9CAUL|nr:polysaccharide deacetylase [Phenylobacterium soli]RAK54515.1 polysaccharide deacetylase [Phenylobacterium soli]